MSVFTKLAASIFAPQNPDGSARSVINGEVQTWGTELERIIDAAVAAGNFLLYETKAALDADLAHDANTAALVVGDSTSNDGLYVKSGASGAGSWSRVGDVPGYSFIRATDAGGSANAIAATTILPINETQLIVLPINLTNDGTPVTVSFNGGSALTIKTAAGNNPAIGGLVGGTVVAGYKDGSEFRMLSDQASAAIQAAAEAAQVAAEAAAAAAQAIANATYFFATWADAQAADIPISVTQISVYGRNDAYDGGGLAFVRSVSEPAHALKLQTNDGAWWEGQGQRYVHTAMFGEFFDATGSGAGPDNSSGLIDMVNYANSVRTELVHFGAGLFNLDAALPTWTYPVKIIATKGRGASGNAPTTLYKRYVEASSTRGVLSFSDWGAVVEDINIQANGSASGGAAFSFILTSTSPAASRTFLHRCRVSCGDGVNYSLYVYGMTNTTPAGPGYRGLWIGDCEFFGAASGTISLVGVHHVFATGTFAATSGGSSAIVLQISGNATVYNDDIQWHGILSGQVNINWTSRSVFVSPQTANITVDANTTDTMWVGPRWSGALTNGAAAGEFTFVYDGTVVAKGGNNTTGWRKFGDGRLIQWGEVTTVSGTVGGSWPVAFTTTTIGASARVNVDQGANIINICQLYGVTTTTFAMKSANLNYSSGAVAAPNAIVRWLAEGA